MQKGTFRGPHGDYCLQFVLVEDSTIRARIAGIDLIWHVEVVDEEQATLQGMTNGLRQLWGDEYWFELQTIAPMQIRYYGDGNLVRTDQELPA